MDTRTLLFIVLTASAALVADTKVKLESLPAAVQATVKEQTKSATLIGISSEKEKGKTVYEVETKVNGKTRDLILDGTGAITQTEDEVAFDTVPSAAKAAIQKRVAGGTIQKVERLTAGSIVSYEATVKTKAGKTTEIGVNVDGSPHEE